MNVNSAVLAYFSPTSTTKNILGKISEGMGFDTVDVVDFTLSKNPDISCIESQKASSQIAVLGAPVYGGRLPLEAVNRFKLLKGDNRPAVVVVTYGNRAYEDALLELKDLALELGFKPIAAAAFIGEHSFSTKKTPIAVGRPDADDINKAFEFGKNIKDKLSALQSSKEQIAEFDKMAGDLKIPGNFPYKERHASPPIAPITDEDTCVKCGVCAEMCPTDAVTVGDTVETKAELCLRCCACIKNCPTGAREMVNPKMIEIAQWLNTNFSARKEIETYLPI